MLLTPEPHAMDNAVVNANTESRRCDVAAVPHRALAWSLEGLPNVEMSAEADMWWRRWEQGTAPPGLMLVGPSGIGKSGWLQVAAAKLARQGLGSPGRWNLLSLPRTDGATRGALEVPPVWYFRWADVSRRLLALPRWASDDDVLTYAGFMDTIAYWCTVLIADDVLPPAERGRSEDLFSSLFYRVEDGRPTFLSTNVRPAKLAETFGERWVDRMHDPGYFYLVKIDTPSARVG